ncbi:MAG: hypothetical protein FJ318_08440 [SAR202 cluster bacterium]|nr:hypothetical protein [SAR202 cluster bacterium]
MPVPNGWELTGLLVSSEFAAGAACAAVRIVDREAPSDSGQAPFLYQSLAQVCARPVDGRSLEAFMVETYGADRGGFAPASVGGKSAYRLTQDHQTTIFLQSGTRRFQVIASVAADSPGLEALRVSQVNQILSSLTFD